MKRRIFITFSDGPENDALAEILQKSISIFSLYGLRIYRRHDFKEDYGIDSDPQFWSSGKGYVYKILSCMKALEEYDEVVWIDTDCVATSYIDKIWFESWRISEYPLLPKSRFYLFGRDLSVNSDLIDTENPHFLRKGKERLSVTDTSTRPFYSQACFMLFTKKCERFFMDILSLFNNFEHEVFPNGDETMINCMMWRNGFEDSLGEIFICSHYFGFYSNEIASMKTREQFMNFSRFRPSKNIFENILFYHGSKSTSIAESILDTLTKTQKNIDSF